MSNWINANESKPFANEVVLVFYAWLEGSGWDVGRWEGDDWHLGRRGKASEAFNGLCRVLFWMPIPPVPQWSFTVSVGTDQPETINGLAPTGSRQE